MENKKEELDQKEFPFMDETPPSLLFPFMVENDEKKGENDDN